ncbi:MAG: amidohydrolase family protein, partial [Fimbriimonadaceae bacterium]|nr:amidohydrolase family protein [Fimbriimonadaceae bacterium]
MKLLVCALSLLGIAGNQAPPRYDLLIKGGRIVDGTGNPAYFADVAVSKGKIVRIGRNLGVADRTLDAKGMVVAPGFIDVHTHADDDLRRLPEAENFIRNGVTSIVTGNCGGSVRNVARYFDDLVTTGCALNV